MSISPYDSYQESLLTRNVCLLNVISIDRNTVLEAPHPNKKNPIQGNFSNAPHDVLDCVKKWAAIREFVSC
jgi:hypothetical protein